jgi:hypothetical protein
MPKSKSIHFFATRGDLEPVLIAVESQQPLQYVQAGMFDVPEMIVVTTGLQIPNIGLAPSGESNLEPFWLITDVSKKVEMKVVPQRRGGTRYGIDPGLNPESVVLWPGGLCGNSVLVAGQVGTAMFNPFSLELANLFTREIRRRFKRIKSFYIGPEAEQLLDAGYRLTIGVNASPEIDLVKD